MVLLGGEMQCIRGLREDLLSLHARFATVQSSDLAVNSIDSILVMYLTLEECFAAMSEEPANFMFTLRSRLVDYGLFHGETHLLDLFSYSAALHFNKSLK